MRINFDWFFATSNGKCLLTRKTIYRKIWKEVRIIAPGIANRKLNKSLNLVVEKNDQTVRNQQSSTLKITFKSISLICQEKMSGCALTISSMRSSTSLLATLGFEPPITPGLILPVSWYLFNIFDTHPWETRSSLEITHGRIPAAAISTICNRTWLGRGRPFMNTPPSWFTRPCPIIKNLFYLIRKPNLCVFIAPTHPLVLEG